MTRIAFAMIFACASGGVAQAQVVLNQIGTPPGGSAANMVSAPGASASQIFEPVNATFNCMTIDDFTVGGPALITTVAAAYETSISATNLSTAITGFRVSVFSSIANASTSGNNLDLNTVSTALIPTSAATFQAGFGPGNANSSLITIDTTSAGLTLPSAGTYFIGVSAVMNFSPNGQVFLYSSTFSDPVGGGNAVFINPGGGFGAGTSQLQAYDAAYFVQVVPEPTLALGLLLPVGLWIRRRVV